jgi:hypothetical protein
MGISDQQTQQKIPFSYDKTYDALVKAIPRAGLKLQSEDKLLGRITATTGISLMSYGENITLLVEKVDAESALVRIESSLKVALNLFGGSKHQKNFDLLIAALSAELQGKGPVPGYEV